jgi:hypothetical protein
VHFSSGIALGATIKVLLGAFYRKGIEYETESLLFDNMVDMFDIDSGIYGVQFGR